ncbi:aspartate/glutamate racemase family protein [Pseudoteredinibacter isoporae]|uniref:Allantoin racemase n=1 Tax=Pseudoteredinibacter isoporae TaxID=570281 RepID=A0A7X0MUX6_9GAMM|nr:aspartate/glutamate racemase family protein [Pseudoteredinibacter isoporae]MBB6521131.1 allantoin racemase [Pseudoteredinibacter isoporae]NHO86692.1 hydantoin racemase [Pseudoteredinibacter isoporae]NIB24856.1 hydantoin racemase [Pseudoteredinibacter isoporae]
MEKTKILWINPINVDAYDQPMGEFIDTIRLPGTEVEVISFRGSIPLNNLEYRTFEAMTVADTVHAARYADEQGFDAAVIGCFYDPALEDAREISGKTVVIAPCQASVQLASNLANNFSVIIGQEKWRAQMSERIHAYGYGSRLASMRSIDIPVPDLQKDCEYTAEKIIDAGRLAIQEDKAESLILGCTCTFGLFETVQKELNVPVIDPIVAAFKSAEFMGSLKKQFQWYPSRKWTSAAPPEELIQSFGLFKNPPSIGNRYLLKEAL